MAPRRPANTVRLNVYDLAESNAYTHDLGVGVYHSGVEVCGAEYTFSESGVFSHSPKGAESEGAVFREAVDLGVTDLTGREVQGIVDSMRADFPGKAYMLTLT